MRCRICGVDDFRLVVDLNDQPWGNHFLQETEIGKESFYPLRVIYCRKCKLSQLDHTVKKETMFSNHTYLSGTTKSLKNHFEATAKFVNDNYCQGKKDKIVLDIGSNDGTQLQCYKDLGFEVLGVESSTNIANIANVRKITTVNDFFNLPVADKINKTFDVINASGVFFHLEELHSVAQAIKKYLKEDGVFIVQFIYMKSILDNIAFDQIYHEHLLYYTLETLSNLLDMHGLEMFHAYKTSIHGGSIIASVSHRGKREKTKELEALLKEEIESKTNDFSTYEIFAENIEILKEENLKFLKKCKKENLTVYGMGAPVKGNTLLNYFDIGRDLIPFLVEKNTLREGLFSPGKHIPILIEEKLSSPPDVYYVLAWNFKKEILNNNKEFIEKGLKFYFPINPKES